jgi:hypothetical protein
MKQDIIALIIVAVMFLGLYIGAVINQLLGGIIFLVSIVVALKKQEQWKKHQ